MVRPRLAGAVIGLAMVAVWLPLLVTGMMSLPSRGRLGHAEALIVDGPYAYVRHPLYAGLSLTAAGLGLILGTPRLTVAGIGWLGITRLWAVREERGLARRFGHAYEVYRGSTPAMIPDLAGLLRHRGRSSARS